MLQVYDKNNVIQHLSLEYVSVDRMVDEPSYLTMSTDGLIKNEIHIKLSFLEGVPLTLPRTGLIEKSGFNILSLQIDMKLMKDEMNLIQRTRNEIDPNGFNTLSDILHHCPKLSDFSIGCTLLYDFGDGIQLDQKNRFYEEVVFRGSMFGPHFLPSLSHHVSYISDMYIGGCCFADRPASSHMLQGDDIIYVNIHMPDTKFGSITYIRNYTGDFYLTLLKTGEN